MRCTFRGAAKVCTLLLALSLAACEGSSSSAISAPKLAAGQKERAKEVADRILKVLRDKGIRSDVVLTIAPGDNIEELRVFTGPTWTSYGRSERADVADAIWKLWTAALAEPAAARVLVLSSDVRYMGVLHMQDGRPFNPWRE